MTSHFPAPTAAELAEKGILESHEHAETVDSGWTQRAIEKVREYAESHEWFLAEDVRLWSIEKGFEQPPAKGAWGQVVRSAAKLGICHARGRRSAKSAGSHGKKMRRWRRGPGGALEIVTEAKADDDCRFLEDMARRCDLNGRDIFASRFRAIANDIRILASDL
jgi:hypothetical protein